jgi:acid phosphatase
MPRSLRLALPVLAATLAACVSSSSPSASASDRRALDAIDTLVVIYAENRAFDTLFGLFPGANGIPGVNPAAVSRSRYPRSKRAGSRTGRTC